MEAGKVLTAQERIDAINMRRSALAKSEKEARQEQEATDLEAIADLEDLYGHERVIRISLGPWKPGMGAPASVAVKIPLGAEMNLAKFVQRINRAKDGSQEKLSAQDDLAKECWIYPPKGSDAYKAALEIAPMILVNAALQVVLASQGVVESEGKG